MEFFDENGYEKPTKEEILKTFIKPIQTVYKGYKFRSRLEARWAVFFDALKVNWQYEHEGYNVDGDYYLPDFYFPASPYNFQSDRKPTYPLHDIYAEVKPYGFFHNESKQLKTLIKFRKHKDIIVLIDNPCNEQLYEISQWEKGFNDRDGNPTGKMFSLIDWDGNNNWFRTYISWVFDVDQEIIQTAITASKQARFEHGEVG